MHAQPHQTHVPRTWSESDDSRPHQAPLASDMHRTTDPSAPLTLPAPCGPETALFDAYQKAGGTLTSDEFICLLRNHCGQPLSMLARRIVARELITFSWRGQTLIPMFQLEPVTGSTRSDVLVLLAELAPALDEEEVARWFVRPNPWLLGGTPVACLSEDFNAVLHAARTDRFVAAG